MYFVYIPVNNEKYITEQKKKIINGGLGGICKGDIADNGFIACVWSSPTEIQPRLLEKGEISGLSTVWFHVFSIYDIRVTVFNRRGKTTAFLGGCWCMWRSEMISPYLFVAYLSLSFCCIFSDLHSVQSFSLIEQLLLLIMLANIAAPPSPKGSSSEAKCKQGCCICFISPVLKMEIINLKWLQCVIVLLILGSKIHALAIVFWYCVPI